MSDLFRSEKAPSDWTSDFLESLNIRMQPVTGKEFGFPSDLPSLDHMDHDLVTASGSDTNPNQAPGTAATLMKLVIATGAGATRETSIDVAIQRVLEDAGFESAISGTTVNGHWPTPLMMSGQLLHGLTDVCVLSRKDAFLILPVENKTISNPTPTPDVEAQLTAQAISIFQTHNKHLADAGLPTLSTMRIPCIRMSGTTPTFYIIPVTRKLSDTLATDPCTRPQTPTMVLKHEITHLYPGWNREEGMRDPGFREVALKSFVAFKGLAQACWRDMDQDDSLLHLYDAVSS
ncbi:hypothetical protein DFP72DRAFT_1003842 [Ephemerocybe angulata]|uniref:Uncharacterized protein n=1 Tax=Ephemerocybe angulata TaxID=980116 RepID=A0A8H6I849_9AGAR|nr:hypothetical protein DFP72DRAFT_1003842 [Tulosesus angulatus]